MAKRRSNTLAVLPIRNEESSESLTSFDSIRNSFLDLGNGTDADVLNALEEEKILFTGWLTKQGSKWKTWKTRWFVLTNRFLFYYTNEKEETMCGMILLAELAVRVYENETPHSMPNPFSLFTPTRIYHISARTSQDLSAWVTAIRNAKEKVLETLGEATSTLGQETVSGYLQKQGHYNKSWKQRYFILSNQSLKYYKNEQSNVPLGTIDLSTNECYLESGSGRYFAIFTPKRTFYLKYDGNNETESVIDTSKQPTKSQWLQNLRSQINTAMNPSLSRQNSSSTPTLAKTLPPHLVDIVKEGYLQKRGQMNQSFKKRWFVLTKKCCYYYSTPDSVVPRGRIFMSINMHLISADDNELLYLSSATRRYTLRASSTEERNKWVSAFELVLKSYNISSMQESIVPSFFPPSEILDLSMMKCFWTWIPVKYQLEDAYRVYTTSEDGYELKKLYHKCLNVATFTSACVLIIKTLEDNIFGAFFPGYLRMTDEYYGTPEVFVFRLAPTMVKYPATQSNSYFILSSSSCLAFGGGGNAIALSVDEELNGTSEKCKTFNNDCLNEDNSHFVSSIIELYTFSPTPLVKRRTLFLADPKAQ